MRKLEGGELNDGEPSSGFARKIAAADGQEYAADEAEERDLRYMIANSCLSCNRLLHSYMVKVVPSRYVQEKDRYVREGVVLQRVMCIKCYNSLKLRTRLGMIHSATRPTRPPISSFVSAYIIKH